MARRRSRPTTPEPEHGVAKVFWTGRSQAIRIPRAFRVSTAEVKLRRQGKALVLEPVELETDSLGWPVAFWRLSGAAPGFQLGPRPRRHERGDVLRIRRPR